MEKVLFLAFIIIIAGSSNGLPALRLSGPPIPSMPDPHAGHDHKHGHHHDGIADVVMEHLGSISWSSTLKIGRAYYLNVPPIIYA